MGVVDINFFSKTKTDSHYLCAFVTQMRYSKCNQPHGVTVEEPLHLQPCPDWAAWFSETRNARHSGAPGGHHDGPEGVCAVWVSRERRRAENGETTSIRRRSKEGVREVTEEQMGP